MYSYGPPHMAVQKQDDQHEHTFSNYVRIRDVVQKTCLRRWTIGKSGERGSGISVLPARHDDDDYYYYYYWVFGLRFKLVLLVLLWLRWYFVGSYHLAKCWRKIKVVEKNEDVVRFCIEVLMAAWSKGVHTGMLRGLVVRKEGRKLLECII